MPHLLLAIHLHSLYLARSANIRLTISARKLTILDIEGKKLSLLAQMSGRSEKIPMKPPRESQRPENNTVRIATAASIPKVLKQLGYDPVPLLAELGLELSLFDDPDNVIPYALRSRLIQLCVKTTDCQHFGLLVGQHIGLSSVGLVGF